MRGTFAELFVYRVDNIPKLESLELCSTGMTLHLCNGNSQYLVSCALFNEDIVSYPSKNLYMRTVTHTHTQTHTTTQTIITLMRFRRDGHNFAKRLFKMNAMQLPSVVSCQSLYIMWPGR